jgi:hypothetical protein
MKIFIATPAFDGKTHVQYATSLSDTTSLLTQAGIGYQLCVTTSGSLLAAERNKLISLFMQSDCTHILCIDSDLGWPAQAIPAMLLKDVEFIAGLYPTRKIKQFLFRNKTNENGSLIVDADKKLIKMQCIPAGFMLIKRSAIQKMIDKFPELYFSPKDKAHEPRYALFNTELIDEEFWGEDYVFCRRAEEAGIDIWIDPAIQFDHAGIIGSFSEALTDDKSKI